MRLRRVIGIFRRLLLDPHDAGFAFAAPCSKRSKSAVSAENSARATELFG